MKKLSVFILLLTLSSLCFGTTNWLTQDEIKKGRSDEDTAEYAEAICDTEDEALKLCGFILLEPYFFKTLPIKDDVYNEYKGKYKVIFIKPEYRTALGQTFVIYYRPDEQVADFYIQY